MSAGVGDAPHLDCAQMGYAGSAHPSSIRNRSVMSPDMSFDYKVADLGLAEAGRHQLRLAETSCPVSWPCASSTVPRSRSRGPESLGRSI